MPLSARDKIARQLDLEDESRALGSARYRAMRPLPWRKDASSMSDEAELPPGRKLLKMAVDPTAQAIDEWCNHVANSGACKRPLAFRLLSSAGSREVAYLTARTVLNASALRHTLTAAAFQVAACLIEHIEMTLLRDANKSGFKGVIKRAAKANGSSKMRQALKKIMDKEGIPSLPQPHARALRLPVELYRRPQRQEPPLARLVRIRAA